MDFENKVYEGIHYSRFLVSWIKSNGKLNGFKKWLQHLIINGKPIPKEVICDIYYFGTNGKLELEEDAEKFINSKD